MTLEVSLCRKKRTNAYDAFLEQKQKEESKVRALQEKVEVVFARIHDQMLWSIIQQAVMQQGRAPEHLLIIDLRSELTEKYHSFYQQFFDIIFGCDIDYRRTLYDYLSPDIQSQLLKKIEEECVPKLNEKFPFMHFTLEEACLYASYKPD